MTEALHHRGPDDGDIWMDSGAGIALGHARLAVLDLTAAGRQPMMSASGRYVLVFNGEIYNHLALRRQLEQLGNPISWRGHSDTETLLAAIEQWGLTASLVKCIGMFSLALWDRREQVLSLARDRLGEKPMYYGWQRHQFLFGSELKAIRAHDSANLEIDRHALARYLRQGYVRGPGSIYRGIRKLQPGCLVQLSRAQPVGSMPDPVAYWSLGRVVQLGIQNPFRGTDEDAIERLDAELTRSVALQSVADVPVGAFLSGGIDSSAVVALMQKQSPRAVNTFSIGFREQEFDEAQYAKSVARHLGTEHTEAYVTPNDAMDAIPEIAKTYDEPFGDSSALPTILVSRLARTQVKVSLSGDGGDELFGGYTRYQRNVRAWSLLRRFPGPLRRRAATVLGVVADRWPASRFSWRAGRLAAYLRARNVAECYWTLTSQALNPSSLILGEDVRNDEAYSGEIVTAHDDDVARMMYQDTIDYLPDDILVKVDRASMAVSLESRIPLLDAQLVEFAWSLPLHMKVRNGTGKWILRQVLRKYVPDSLVDRPKMGFGVPLGNWLRGPLREWAEDLLSTQRLDEAGYLRGHAVRNLWNQFLAGHSQNADNLWQLLMFQDWQTSLASTRPH